jgi:hypothetical protein
MITKEKKRETVKKYYIVMWTFDGEERHTSLVEMTEAQADKVDDELRENVNVGTLQNYSVDEAEEVSHKDLLDNMEESGLRPEKDEEEDAA